MRSLLHIFTAALLVICLTYAAFAWLPFWAAWTVAVILTIAIGAYWEWYGNKDYIDMAFDAVGIIPGTLAVVLIREHWQPNGGLYWLAPLVLAFMFFSAFGWIQKLKKGA